MIHGCPTCLYPGEHNRTHIFTLGTFYPLHTGTQRAFTDGERSLTVVQGIKGTSSLRNYLYLVNGVPIDYIYCILEGVVSSLLIAWTDSKYLDKTFSIFMHLHHLIEPSLNSCLSINLFFHLDPSLLIFLTGRLINYYTGLVLFHSILLFLSFFYTCLHNASVVTKGAYTNSL